MAKIFEFNSILELKDKVENKDLILTIEVFTQIKKALNGKRKVNRVKAFTAKINDNVLNFILDRDQWGVSLNTCLDVFSNNDMFEECIEIQKLQKLL